MAIDIDSEDCLVLAHVSPQKSWSEEFDELLTEIGSAEDIQQKVLLKLSQDLKLSADWLACTITGEATATPLQRVMIRSWLMGYLARQ